MREIWRIKFRTSPDEYVFVHAVPVTQIGTGFHPEYAFEESFCGRTVPENMQHNVESYGLFINKELANCPECLSKAAAVIAAGPPKLRASA